MLWTDDTQAVGQKAKLSGFQTGDLLLDLFYAGRLPPIDGLLVRIAQTLARAQNVSMLGACIKHDPDLVLKGWRE